MVELRITGHRLRVLGAGVSLGVPFAAIFIACQSPNASETDRFTQHVRGAVSTADATVASTADAVAPSELAAIADYWRKNFYDDTDIVRSFDTAAGDHIDCIPFGAQHSVRARVAHGLTVAPPPPQGFIPISVESANIPTAPGGNDKSVDAKGRVRVCPTGTVMRKRPSAVEIEARGGLDAYASWSKHRPKPQNSQDLAEHDCWDNAHPLNYASAPPAQYCAGMNGGRGYQQGPGAGTCGNYDHAVGIQRGQWLPSLELDGHLDYSAGFYGISSITPQYVPTVDYDSVRNASEHSVSQFWMQTGTCENWWNGNNDAGAGQQCNMGNACTTEGNCAVQSMELGLLTQYEPAAEVDGGTGATKSSGVVFYTPDGYFGGCYSAAADADCPCYASGGCTASTCGGDRDCPNTDEICDPVYHICETVQPYVSVTDAYYTPGTYVTAASYGSTPSEIPIQVWNGTAKGYPYYYIFMYGQWIGWYPNTIFKWPYSEGITDAGGAGENGPMVAGPATYLQVGGEVFQEWPYYPAPNKSYHSKTSMASDYAPTHSPAYKYASYQRNVQYMDSTGTISDMGGTYTSSGLQAAALTFATTETSPAVPEGNLDTNSTWPDGVPGLCGYPAGQFTPEDGTLRWYSTSTTATPGASGGAWGTYFYFGTEGPHGY